MTTRDLCWAMWVGTGLFVLACRDNGNLVAAAQGKAGDAGSAGSGVEVPASGGARNMPAGQGGTNVAGAQHTAGGDTGGAARANNGAGGITQTAGDTGGTTQTGGASQTGSDTGGITQTAGDTGGTAQAGGSDTGGITQTAGDTGGTAQAGGSDTGGAAQAGSDAGGASQTGGNDAGGAEPAGTAGAAGATVNPADKGIWHYQWMGDNISFIQIALCDAGKARFLHAEAPTDPDPLILEGTYALLSSPPDRVRASFEDTSDPGQPVREMELTYNSDADTLSRTPASDGYDSMGVRFDQTKMSWYSTYLTCD
jgi:hypothetical protein